MNVAPSPSAGPAPRSHSGHQLLERNGSDSTIASGSAALAKPLSRSHSGHGTLGTFVANPALQALFLRATADYAATSLLTDYTKSQGTGVPTSMRTEFVLQRLHTASANSNKKHSSPTGHALAEQLRAIEEKHRQDLSLLEDMQEFLKLRAKMELEHQQAVSRLAQQFVGKRRWPDPVYNKQQENILLIDLFRLLLQDAQEQCTVSIAAAEEVMQRVGEQMDKRMEEKKTMFKTGFRVLTNLHNELFNLDADVVNAKKNYDAAMKEHQQTAKKAGKKPTEELDRKVKSLESKAKFSRSEYVLELAAANAYYSKFRDDQFPEVLDTIFEPTMQWLAVMLSDTFRALARPAERALHGMQSLDRASGMLSAPYEREQFVARHETEFPDEQIFPLVPHPHDPVRSLEIKLELNNNTRTVLVQIRNLMQHHLDTLLREIAVKEGQLESLYNLHGHFSKAGAVLDKSQNQASTMASKMQKVYNEIEELAVKIEHVRAKIAFITATSIDSGEAVSVATDQDVIDITEAQAREAERRRVVDSVSIGSGSSGSAVVLNNGPGPSSLAYDEEAVRKARQEALEAADKFTRAVGDMALESDNWDGAEVDVSDSAASRPSKLSLAFGFRKRAPTSNVAAKKAGRNSTMQAAQERDSLHDVPEFQLPELDVKKTRAEALTAVNSGGAAVPPPPPPGPAPSADELRKMRLGPSPSADHGGDARMTEPESPAEATPPPNSLAAQLAAAKLRRTAAASGSAGPASTAPKNFAVPVAQVPVQASIDEELPAVPPRKMSLAVQKPAEQCQRRSSVAPGQPAVSVALPPPPPELKASAATAPAQGPAQARSEPRMSVAAGGLGLLAQQAARRMSKQAGQPLTRQVAQNVQEETDEDLAEAAQARAGVNSRYGHEQQLYENEESPATANRVASAPGSQDEQARSKLRSSFDAAVLPPPPPASMYEEPVPVDYGKLALDEADDVAALPPAPAPAMITLADRRASLAAAMGDVGEGAGKVGGKPPVQARAKRAPPPAEPEPVTVVFKPKIEKVSMRICRAKYDYKPTQQDDIAMAKKELLYLLAERSDGWTQALNLHGQVGFVPTSYIEEVQPTEGITFAPASKLRINRKQPGEALGMSLAGGSPVYVDDIKENSLSQTAGVKMGDMFLAVNDHPCAGRSRAGVLELLAAEQLELLLINSTDLIETAQQLRRLSRRPSNLDVV